MLIHHSTAPLQHRGIQYLHGWTHCCLLTQIHKENIHIHLNNVNDNTKHLHPKSHLGATKELGCSVLETWYNTYINASFADWCHWQKKWSSMVGVCAGSCICQYYIKKPPWHNAQYITMYSDSLTTANQNYNFLLIWLCALAVTWVVTMRVETW